MLHDVCVLKFQSSFVLIFYFILICWFIFYFTIVHMCCNEFDRHVASKTVLTPWYLPYFEYHRLAQTLKRLSLINFFKISRSTSLIWEDQAYCILIIVWNAHCNFNLDLRQRFWRSKLVICLCRLNTAICNEWKGEDAYMTTTTSIIVIVLSSYRHWCFHCWQLYWMISILYCFPCNGWTKYNPTFCNR